MKDYDNYRKIPINSDDDIVVVIDTCSGNEIYRGLEEIGRAHV